MSILTMAHDPHDPKLCRAMFEKLSEYIDQELDVLTCAEIERHAEGCISCRVCLGTLQQAIALCKEMKSEPVPSAFSTRLQDLVARLG